MNTVLFDLDGTLLPMDQEAFIRLYFGALTQKFAPHGFEPEKLIQGPLGRHESHAAKQWQPDKRGGVLAGVYCLGRRTRARLSAGF